MASASITYSQFSANVKAVHTGVLCTGGHLSRSVTICPSTVHNMCQVPNNCTLVDFWMRIQHAADDDQATFQIGTSQTPSGIMSITTITQTYSFSASISLDILTLNIVGDSNHGTIRAPGGTRGDITGVLTDLMPVRISLSDDVAPSNVWIQGRGAAWSATGFLTFMLFYTMDGLTGRTTIR